jgi:hypothetical protein
MGRLGKTKIEMGLVLFAALAASASSGAQNLEHLSAPAKSPLQVSVNPNHDQNEGSGCTSIIPGGTDDPAKEASPSEPLAWPLVAGAGCAGFAVGTMAAGAVALGALFVGAAVAFNGAFGGSNAVAYGAMGAILISPIIPIITEALAIWIASVGHDRRARKTATWSAVVLTIVLGAAGGALSAAVLYAGNGSPSAGIAAMSFVALGIFSGPLLGAYAGRRTEGERGRSSWEGFALKDLPGADRQAQMAY